MRLRCGRNPIRLPAADASCNTYETLRKIVGRGVLDPPTRRVRRPRPTKGDSTARSAERAREAKRELARRTNAGEPFRAGNRTHMHCTRGSTRKVGNLQV